MNHKEIDRLVAEKVMGWNDVWQPFFPSTNIRDAWLVVEKMKPYHLFKLTQSAMGDWWAYFHDCRVYNESAPLAICLAALKSVGVEVEG